MPLALPPAPVPQGLLAPQHLLVVDDQRLDRAITLHAAGRMGFQVKGTATIAGIRTLLENGPVFDFVVLDLARPRATRAVYRLAHILTGAARNVGATMLANRAAALGQRNWR